MISKSLRKHIVEPLRASWNGIPKIQYWRELERSQFHSLDAIRQRQWSSFKSLLGYIASRNPYYSRIFAEHHVHPHDIHSLEDLRKLPLLTKEAVRQHTPEMISSDFSPSSLLQFKTGGSTGKPLTLYVDERSSEFRNACTWRSDRWAGWDLGDPVGAVWGNPALPTSLASRIRHWLLTPHIYLDTMGLTESAVVTFDKEWRRIRPTVLFGHAHSLFHLALYIQRLGITSIRPKGIISSSMVLIPSERKVIEATFGTPVFDRYGCEEVSLIASECEQHSGMHINSDHILVEFIKEDGTDARPGEPGRIVVTDLLNKAMPLLRYVVEDVGIPSARICPCGRGLPLMEAVAGRVADFLTKPDGTKIAGISLIENTLTKIPGIDQMQIIQESLESIILNLVSNPDFTPSRQNELIHYFQALFGHSMRIQLQFMDEILPEASGKYRFSISRV